MRPKLRPHHPKDARTAIMVRAFRLARVVVRGRIELPTFRFSGRTITLLTENVPAWMVPAGCSRLPVVVVVVVTVVVDSAHASS